MTGHRGQGHRQPVRHHRPCSRMRARRPPLPIRPRRIRRRRPRQSRLPHHPPLPRRRLLPRRIRPPAPADRRVRAAATPGASARDPMGCPLRPRITGRVRAFPAVRSTARAADPTFCAETSRWLQPPGEPGVSTCMSRTPGSLQQMVGSRLSLSLTASPTAARRAREALASGSDVLYRKLGRDGLLLLTELVNNAVIHGSRSPSDEVSVEILGSPTSVRVEVRDDGAEFSWRHPPDSPERVTGYGLVLVDAVAESWGIDASSGRTCVWFEL